MVKMVRHTLFALLATCSLVSAGPAQSMRSWLPSRRDKHADEFIDYSHKIAEGTECECDLSQASPPQAPTPLPPPAAGLSLSHVAIGRGTQNYTCDLTNSSAVPAAIGAVASLFNVTCLAAKAPGLVSFLPTIALDLPIPSTISSAEQSYFDLSGHHYFLNTTTAFFNMDTDAHDYGTGAFHKVNSSSAPTGSMVGQDNKGDGAVAWLKLSALNGGGQVFQEVYRVNTAGGNPPTTCSGMPASFEVQYSAAYWLYT